jgi:hypothetical protein
MIFWHPSWLKNKKIILLCKKLVFSSVFNPSTVYRSEE